MYLKGVFGVDNLIPSYVEIYYKPSLPIAPTFLLALCVLLYINTNQKHPEQNVSSLVHIRSIIASAQLQ